MKLLTGNDLKTGFVTWWTGADWSLHIEDAADVGEAGEAILAVEEAARRVNAPYIIAGEQTADGPRPALLMDAPPPEDVRPFARLARHLPRLRLLGPQQQGFVRGVEVHPLQVGERLAGECFHEA